MSYYSLLLRKSILRQFQYRSSLYINILGSIIFGFIYIAIWQATLGGQNEVIGLNSTQMSYYIAFTQSLSWITIFLPRGLSIQDSIRNGDIGIQLMRPTSFFMYKLSQTLGSQSFYVIFRSLPIFIVFSFIIGGANKVELKFVPLLVVSVLFSAYIGFLLQFFVGIVSFWSIDNRWAILLNFTFAMTLSGVFIPIDVLPEPISNIGFILPYASLHYYPALVYLGEWDIINITIPLFWCVFLTLLALAITKKARRKLEVQGG